MIPLSEEFIESVVEPDGKRYTKDMIAREFDGLEAIASFDGQIINDGGDEDEE